MLLVSINLEELFCCTPPIKFEFLTHFSNDSTFSLGKTCFNKI